MDENSKINILVVDDVIDNLKVVGGFLLEKGYNIHVANDGLSCLKVLKSVSIDLILLDILMPGMSGYEVCEKIKADPGTQNIPIIFLSAKSESVDIVKGFEAGGVDYVTKPFIKEVLLARVGTHVRLKKTYDFLEKYSQDATKTRDQYMNILLNLGKIIDQENKNKNK